MKKLKTIMYSVVLVVASIIFFPITITIYLLTESITKRFRFLKQKGFKVIKDGNAYLYSKDNLCFRVSLDKFYEVSFNFTVENPKFINVYDAIIGSPQERESLKLTLYRNLTSTSLERQRGEAPNTAIEFAQFIKDHIDEFQDPKQ